MDRVNIEVFKQTKPRAWIRSFTKKKKLPKVINILIIDTEALVIAGDGLIKSSNRFKFKCSTPFSRSSKSQTFVDTAQPARIRICRWNTSLVHQDLFWLIYKSPVDYSFDQRYDWRLTRTVREDEPRLATVPTLQLWKVKRRAEQRFQKGTADSGQVAATHHRPELTWDNFGIGSGSSIWIQAQTIGTVSDGIMLFEKRIWHSPAVAQAAQVSLVVLQRGQRTLKRDTRHTLFLVIWGPRPSSPRAQFSDLMNELRLRIVSMSAERRKALSFKIVTGNRIGGTQDVGVDRWEEGGIATSPHREGPGTILPEEKRDLFGLQAFGNL
jgi:hypothetical protein